MKIERFRYFIAVANAKSISKTARQLYLSQSALTQQINALEHDLGVNLFIRYPNGVNLTPMGEKLLPYAKRLIADYDSLIDAIHLEVHSRYLRIAYTGPLEQRLLQQTIPLFHHHYPNVDIQLANYSMVQLTKVVEANECDIALVVPKEVDDPHYHHRMIMQRPICVAVSKSSPLASFTEVAMDQLFDQKFVVLWPQASTHASQQIRTWLLDMGWPKSNIIYADNIESQLLMVSLNEGITLMPKGHYDESIQLIPLVQPSHLIHTTEAVWKADDPIVLTMIDLLTRQSNTNT